MRKAFLLLLSIVCLSFAACKKNSVSAEQQATIDDGKIQAYIKANNINATKDASGLYYQVITPGTGPYPTASSTVTVNYTGTLLDGTQFDKESGIQFPLAEVIKGWQVGIPHINTGGRILLLIPSALGYGSSAQSGIPGNSVLVFTIDLVGFH